MRRCRRHLRLLRWHTHADDLQATDFLEQPLGRRGARRLRRVLPTDRRANRWRWRARKQDWRCAFNKLKSSSWAISISDSRVSLKVAFPSFGITVSPPKLFTDVDVMFMSW